MKTSNLYRPAAILTGVAVFMCTCLIISPARAQDKKEQKVTATVTASPSKDKNQKKVTVVAKSDYKNKDGEVNIRIIKEENGKKTEIDTVISSQAGIDSEDLEKLMKTMHLQMKDADNQMKDVNVYISTMNDSVSSDSSDHHQYRIKVVGPKCCRQIRIKGSPPAFNYNFEIPDIPEPPDAPEYFENEIFNHQAPGPNVIISKRRGESLLDVLGDIPMNRVKSYKIIDKKGGKRIVIDIEDGPSL